MNDFSKNKYYIAAVGGKNGLEFAIERHVPRDEAELLVGCVVALHGFNMHLQGTRYLISILNDYIFKDDFAFEASVAEIAEDEEVEYEYVISCILSSIENNLKFIPIATKLLEQKIEYTDPLIYNVLEIMGAAFKIYYNCIIEENAATSDIADVVEEE